MYRKLALGVGIFVVAVRMYVTFILVSGAGTQLRLQWVDLTQQFNRCTFRRRVVVNLLSIASSFHVDHEQVDFVPVYELEYDEVIEEYEEELFTQEGGQEPIGTDFADPAPAQGKPWCITPIL